MCAEDSRLSIVTTPPHEGPMTLRSGQFWQVYSDLDLGGMVRGSGIIHEIWEVYHGSIPTRRWQVGDGCSPSNPLWGLTLPCLPTTGTPHRTLNDQG